MLFDFVKKFFFGDAIVVEKLQLSIAKKCFVFDCLVWSFCRFLKNIVLLNISIFSEYLTC